jgi:hypothetical protein
MAQLLNLDINGSITCHAWNRDNSRKNSNALKKKKKL